MIACKKLHRAIASSILPWRLGGSLKKRRRSQPLAKPLVEKVSPEKFPLCDRSLLTLCSLRLERFVKKSDRQSPQCVGDRPSKHDINLT
ncbi:hypothetical protein [Nostoc sp. DedQUE07]|uniref:hypothetical protein n=1 Tax=Nostoc sp. DedQUE07 TaxID=3075392 RepID=UPI002AD502C0|nr:hypothetical protein [Nostoc sp. DedQUE07]MDZ8128391.1 hypothetical protein [Nostoc sp. DedQUE07]